MSCNCAALKISPPRADRQTSSASVRAARPSPSDTRPRQQRRVEFKRRVFGGRAGQHHSAVFHHGQERVLLCTIEPVHLVDEQQRAPARLTPRARRIECFLQVGDAGKHRRKLLEMQIGRVGQKPRHGGLAGARRAPEDQRAERAGLQHARKRAVSSQDVILTDDLGERARTQPIGKRPRRVLIHRCGREQGRSLLLWSLRTHPPSVTLICWPLRISVMRQTRVDWLVAFSRSLVFPTFVLFTARMTSPFWKPTLAAVESSPSSVMTTPSVSASRCNSSATAGEILATFAPWNGERELSTISLRPVSGAVSSGTVSLTALPPRCTSICEVPPSGWVAKR